MARIVAPPLTDLHLINRWKEEVKTELRQEVHEQLATISKTLVDEVRIQLSPTVPSDIHQGQGGFPRGGVEHVRYQ